MFQSLCWGLYVLTTLAHCKSVTDLRGDYVFQLTEETEALLTGYSPCLQLLLLGVRPSLVLPLGPGLSPVGTAPWFRPFPLSPHSVISSDSEHALQPRLVFLGPGTRSLLWDKWTLTGPTFCPAASSARPHSLGMPPPGMTSA